jgi:hypothetical protein
MVRFTCPSCNHTDQTARYPGYCPHCGQPLPPRVVVVRDPSDPVQQIARAAVNLWQVFSLLMAIVFALVLVLALVFGR